MGNNNSRCFMLVNQPKKSICQKLKILKYEGKGIKNNRVSMVHWGGVGIQLGRSTCQRWGRGLTGKQKPVQSRSSC